MKRKLYYLADILTLAEVCFAGILTWMAIDCTWSNWAFWLFVAGELCDAFDGICARSFPYPDPPIMVHCRRKRHEDHYWWRKYAKFYDKASDIMLALACAFYMMKTCAPVLGGILLFGGSIVCLVIEIIATCMDAHDKSSENIRLYRRDIVYVPMISIAVIVLLFSTSYNLFIKIVLLICAIDCGVIMLKLKWNRLTEVDTPLNDKPSV